jgi:hypothetical protein
VTAVQVRVSSQWLRLREPADAAARSVALAQQLAAVSGRRGGGGADGGPRVVHDLGSGTGSMGRWLAPLLDGPQHWVLHDRDPDLLRVAADGPAPAGADGSPGTVETRVGANAGLGPESLAGASLVTASALLDMLTADELDHLVRTCVGAGSPTLLTLSVTGEVRLSPSDPFDHELRDAFNEHQRRTTGGRTLLGPDAVRVAARAFVRLGSRVEVQPSPWRLDGGSAALLREWLDGWVGAACEQRPELASAAGAYLARRDVDLDRGRLAVTVPHLDLLAVPPGAAT